jgi:hypothetical protein
LGANAMMELCLPMWRSRRPDRVVRIVPEQNTARVQP